MPHKTIDLPGVELFQVGIHNGDSYTVEDLRQMVAAAGRVGFEPPLKLGHMSDDDTKTLLKKEGMPALGWVKSLRVKGQKLLGDLIGVPRRVADLIKRGAYKRVSAEIYWNYKKGAETFPRVLKAVALLGAEIPALTDLKGLEALYDDQGNEYRAYYLDVDMPGMVEARVPHADLGPPQKAKAEVDYRLASGSLERCGSCLYYLGASEAGAIGACWLVEGEVAADAVCDLYAEREAYRFPGGEGIPEERRTAQKRHQTLSVQEQDGQHCVVRAMGDGDQGETVKCFPTREEAEAHMTEMRKEMKHLSVEHGGEVWQSEDAGETWTVPVKDYIISKRGDEWCLLSKTTGKTLGCHPTKEGAMAQELAIQAAKHQSAQWQEVRFTREAMSRLCPPCADRMTYSNLRELKIRWNPSTGEFEFPVGMFQFEGREEQALGWCKKLGTGDPGFFERCMKHPFPDQTDQAGFCAALHKFCLAEYPGEHRGESSEHQRGRATAQATDAGAGPVHSVGEGQTMSTELTLKEQEIAELKARLAKMEHIEVELGQTKAAIAELEALKGYSAKLTTMEAELAQAQARLSDLQQTRRRDEIRAFLLAKKREGKVLPKDEAKWFALLETADETKTVVYHDGSQEHKLSQRQLIETLIAGSPQLVSFAELSKGDGGQSAEDPYTDPGKALAERVTKYQHDHPEVGYADAVKAVLAVDPQLKKAYAIMGAGREYRDLD